MFGKCIYVNQWQGNAELKTNWKWHFVTCYLHCCSVGVCVCVCVCVCVLACMCVCVCGRESSSSSCPSQCLWISLTEWSDEQLPPTNILRLIYQGRFLHGNVTLAGMLSKSRTRTGKIDLPFFFFFFFFFLPRSWAEAPMLPCFFHMTVPKPVCRSDYHVLYIFISICHTHNKNT